MDAQDMIYSLLTRLMDAHKTIGRMEGEIASLHQEIVRAGPSTRDHHISNDNLVKLIRFARNGEKISAIKLVREVSGLGLKDAKFLVDDGW